MLTDNDIKKGLRCCGRENCRGCPYRENCHQGNPMIRDALDLIIKLEAEKEALINGQETLQKYLAEQKAENERLSDLLKRHQRHTNRIRLLTAETAKKIKAETYKEFAERIHCHCQSIINQEWNKKVAPVSWADAYEQFDDETDNLLKELVGDNNV